MLTTSGEAFSKLSGYNMTTYEKEEGDIDGPFALAVAVTETLDDGGETELIWVSSAYLLDDATNQGRLRRKRGLLPQLPQLALRL